MLTLFYTIAIPRNQTHLGNVRSIHFLTVVEKYGSPDEHNCMK